MRKRLKGLRCPHCDGLDHRVIDVHAGRGYIRRRHTCRSATCQAVTTFYGQRAIHGFRWTSYEFNVTRGTLDVPQETPIGRTFRRELALQAYP
jgi:hypothetical protein